MNIPPHVTIESQPRDEAALLALVEEVKRTPFIGQFSLEELRALQRAGTIRYFYVGEALAGFAAWSSISAEWVELGPIYAAESHRDSGIGNLLADFIVSYNLEQGRNIYGVTKNPRVKKMFLRHGFTPTPFFKLDRAIQRYLLLRLLQPSRLVQLVLKRTADTAEHYVRPRESK
ncbi:MAG: GNAT family N-acetyltransferase [Anaerolineae bacterium]|nr:GNAT family N-acetyltransferase [Anaerolineae bacterium]MDW8172195.1 hypothetical protein [Anaerolineae bacterium]